MKNSALLISIVLLLFLALNLSTVNSILFGDTNNDNKINILDLAIIGKSFGSTPVASNWNVNADVNKDSKIDILDLATVGKNFDRSYCLSKAYCLTEEDLALSRGEQIKKFGFVVNPSRDVQASSGSFVSASSIPYMPGWPVSTGRYVGSSPALADLDGDGDLEVVIGSADWRVYAWHADGTPAQGWPVETNGSIASSPAIGDIDGDGKSEIVIGSYDNKVYAWHADGTPAQGWPQATGGWVTITSPALGDLDGDRKLEVIIGSDDGKVYAWHADGTLVDGWPQSTGNWVRSSPALGNIDQDGSLEIIVGVYGGGVYAWHVNGSSVQGWPKSTGGDVRSSPALADINDDGKLEIVVGSGDNNVYAWYSNGSSVSGWPVTTENAIYSSPAIGDIGGDGKLEIAIGSYGTRAGHQVYVLHANGTILDGWPVGAGAAYVISSPALGDIDGDGDLEVVVGSVDKNVYAWHSNGSLVEGFPLATGGEVTSSPTLGDIDKDGKIEIVIGSGDGKVYAWKLPGNFDPAKIPWKTHRKDFQRTGTYHTFDDVLTNYWSYNEIEKIYKAGITKGCVANNKEYLYCPKQNVTRDQMASFLVRAFNITPYNNSNQTFVDVPQSYPNYADIEAFYLRNITKGCIVNATGRYYCPTQNVLRDQMASFLVRAFKIMPYDNTMPTFVDVPKTYPNYADIEAFYQQNITKGCMINSTGTYYCPQQPVTREQMAVFLARAFKLV